MARDAQRASDEESRTTTSLGGCAVATIVCKRLRRAYQCVSRPGHTRESAALGAKEGALAQCRGLPVSKVPEQETFTQNMSVTVPSGTL